MSLKKASQSVSTLTVVVPAGTLSPNPLTSSPVKTPENVEEDYVHPEQTGEGGIHMEYPSDSS